MLAELAKNSVGESPTMFLARLTVLAAALTPEDCVAAPAPDAFCTLEAFRATTFRWGSGAALMTRC